MQTLFLMTIDEVVAALDQLVMDQQHQCEEALRVSENRTIEPAEVA